MEKILRTEMCITIRDYCSKSDSKEEDRGSGGSFALRVDETIRKVIDCLSINKEKQNAVTVVS